MYLFNVFPLTSSEAEVHCWWLLGDPYRDPKRGFYSCRCLFAGLNVWHSPHWKRADHGAWYPGVWYQVACDSHEICIRTDLNPTGSEFALTICCFLCKVLLFLIPGFVASMAWTLQTFSACCNNGTWLQRWVSGIPCATAGFWCKLLERHPGFWG